jgi:hypothetical protein
VISRKSFIRGSAALAAFIWLGFTAHVFNLEHCSQVKVAGRITYCGPPASGICKSERFEPPLEEIFCGPPDSDIGGGSLLDSLLGTAILGLGVPATIAALVAGVLFGARAVRRNFTKAHPRKKDG